MQDQPWDSKFQNIVMHNIEFPEVWVATSQLDHH